MLRRSPELEDAQQAEPALGTNRIGAYRTLGPEQLLTTWSDIVSDSGGTGTDGICPLTLADLPDYKGDEVFCGMCWAQASDCLRERCSLDEYQAEADPCFEECIQAARDAIPQPPE